MNAILTSATRFVFSRVHIVCTARKQETRVAQNSEKPDYGDTEAYEQRSKACTKFDEARHKNQRCQAMEYKIESFEGTNRAFIAKIGA